MICKKCGKEYEGKFCPECGTSSDGSTLQAPPVQQPKKKKKGLIAALVVIAVIVA